LCRVINDEYAAIADPPEIIDTRRVAIDVPENHGRRIVIDALLKIVTVEVES
jgi:hypothetical protein